ncbi:MAG: hypothetical protein A3J48_03915 [Candidatus Doudnabacteria bacterium RIFCSPHIGHO2_02_FULL_46_11]|uniref:O-antigen ligase-related domain-containing protein n=1 Tax=Candidatus Doudnabacteria bacterium RIFCSPHIGHO2_02_FULL_46_11 TaxID=1817832 RepID=A0A1F5P810_9BACT|nr:MAG: hypothetical protein A3J48_03915 [Candidatus Doudnabacteria bacterium RIFCSPHIGHO2_02_FULL_46_11]
MPFFNKFLEYFRRDKYLYSAVILEAAVVILMFLGLMPRASSFYLTAGIMLFMLVLNPLQAMRFFVLSLPWVIALPLNEYDKFQTWRILIFEVFLIAIFYRRDEFWHSLKKGYRATADFFRLTKIDYAFFAFLGVSLAVLIFNHGFLAPAIKQAVTYFTLYGIFLTGRLIINSDLDKRALIKDFALSGLTFVAAGFAQLLFFLRTDSLFFWQYWANSVIPVIYGLEYGRLSSEANTWFAYFPDRLPNLRMFSLFPGSQVFAQICLLTAPALLVLREISAKPKQKKMWTVALWTVLLAAALTYVRATVVGLFVPLVLLFVFYLFKKISKFIFKKAVYAIVVFFLILIISPLLQFGINQFSLYERHGGSLFDRTRAGIDLDYESNKTRLIIWKQSFESFKDRPVFGVGAGNYARVFEAEGSTRTFEEIRESKEAFVNSPRHNISAHNILLQVLVESGIIGLVFFLLFLWVLAKRIYELIKSKIGENGIFPRGLFALWLGVAILWVLGHSMFDSVFLTDDEPLTFFFINLAILLGSE